MAKYKWKEYECIWKYIIQNKKLAPALNDKHDSQGYYDYVAYFRNLDDPIGSQYKVVKHYDSAPPKGVWFSIPHWKTTDQFDGETRYLSSGRVDDPYYGNKHGVTYSIIADNTAFHLPTAADKTKFMGYVYSDDRKAFPDDGLKNVNWYVFDGLANQAPTISTPQSTSLGVLTQDSQITYRVSDPDGDAVTIEELVNDKRTSRSPFLATEGTTYTIPIKIGEFPVGKHTITVQATDSKGGKADPLTFTFTRGNLNPIISGKDEDLGDQNVGFKKVFTVDDYDATDELNIRTYLNDEVLKSYSNAVRGREYEVEITDGKLYSLEVGKLNEIRIEVTDGQGGISYRYWYFKRVNTAPVIQAEGKDLGLISEPPRITFSAYDRENEEMKYSIYLNDQLIVDKTELEPNKEISYLVPADAFAQLDNKKVHRLRLIVEDIQKASSSIDLTFKREINECWHITRRPADEIKPTRAFMYVDLFLSPGADYKTYVCNNGLDKSPKWEDCTAETKRGSAHRFTNSEKTADKWCVAYKVEILPGNSKTDSWINGYGGDYE